MRAGRLLLRAVASGVLLLASGSPATAETTLSMKRAVQLALERNAELASLAAEIRAAEARVRGASLLLQSNPEVAIAAGQRSSPGEKLPAYEASIGQRVEIFGQRAARIDAARAGRAGAVARLRDRRVELAAQVQQTFARVLAAEALSAVAREALELARQSELAAERRLQLGDGTRMDVNTARVEVGRAARELSLAQQRRLAALGDLRLMLALDAGVELRLVGGIDELGPPLPRAEDALVRKALEARPELEVARQELAAARAEHRQAVREVLPSPRFEARFERDEGANVFLGGLSMDLPVFSLNQGARGVAVARIEQAQRGLEALERRVKQDVALALSRLALAQEAARAYEGEVVTAMEENLKLATAAYQAGKVGLVELLVIRRDTLDARRGYVEAREELIAAHAELQRAIGQEGFGK